MDSEIDVYSGLCTKDNSAMDEQCVLNLRILNNIMVISEISTNVLALNKAFIYGDLGYIEIADYWKARSAKVHYNTVEELILEHPCQHELIYEIEHFNRCMSDGLLQSQIMNEKITVNTIEILENLQESWK